MERMLNPHGIKFEQQHMGARRRCSICERRLENKAYFLTESEDAPEPQQSWLLCAPCNIAVQTELTRSAVPPVGAHTRGGWTGSQPARPSQPRQMVAGALLGRTG